ncbi:hypothetical protein TI39_contig626g00004 [Zymoseptoria brevis]|uniref:Uncharacterized protein n=1 Tax=Zymoseptoria brevis TaxID=1047168 RepID=A0A0F4GGR0_9PEZI|nr:hypothetical protein TI39_contig626g00004 [Zymoseptoria brevis]
MIAIHLLALASLVARISVRALYIPENLKHGAVLWASDDFNSLRRRQDDTCGGFSNLEQCGHSFPSDFCCSAGTFCLSLNTSSTITAALCCPAGQDCKTINPIDCSKGLQNATQAPQSQLHSSPTASLEQCGSRCCPMGYACRGSFCIAQASEATSSATPSTSTALPSATSPGAASRNDVVPVTDRPDSFSGKAFAAGFVPGIALGGLVVALLIFFCFKRRRGKDPSPAPPKEKRRPAGRDTLTDLGPYMTRGPMVHGRSISEPTADFTMGHRTEFLNSSPPYHKTHEGLTGQAITIDAPITPGSSPPRMKTNWLSHSPFINYATSPVPTQAPLPAHMKRGTLAFQISPVRALRKQRSMHSLRRQITSGVDRKASFASRGQKSTRSDSGETIQVLMPTPEHTPQGHSATLSSATYQPHSDTASWQTTIVRPQPNSQHTIDSSNPTAYFGEQSPIHQDQTLTRPGKNSNVPHIGATLGLRSPYSPSNFQPNLSSARLAVPAGLAEDDRRRKMDSLWPPAAAREETDGGKKWRTTAATTFEGFMEKAGLRRSVLYMGPDPREWNR